MPDTRFHRILVAIETDATRYYGPNASRPALLAPSDAEQMLAHLAADLQALMPDIGRCSLIAPGALYDQTQILQPSYPVFAALEATAAPETGRALRPGLVSIGTEAGVMPVDGLQPLEDIPLGLLQLLPVVIHGPADGMEALTEAMEYRFLEEGQLSAHSAAWLQNAFGVTINHARLMTLTDLNAMLRLQLEHFGFLSLWELLDAALEDRAKPLTVVSASGTEWEWRSGAVHTEFETFDHWAGTGAGAALPASRLTLAAGYADWTRELRQYLTTLNGHGVDVQLHLPGESAPLTETYLTEVSESPAGDGACAVTEHSFDDLGCVAITAVEGDRVSNYYPLRARGLNDIHSLLRERAADGHTVAFPGTILYDEKTRRLQPDCGAGGEAA